MPLSGHGRAGCCPVFTGCRYSLIQDRSVCKTNYDNQVGSAHHVRISWRGPCIGFSSSSWKVGMLLMNEYAVVKVQVKEEHSKECLSPIVLKPQGCQPCAAKYFLSLAIARFMDLATA